MGSPPGAPPHGGGLMAAGGLGAMPGRGSTAFAGFCGPRRRGKTCRSAPPLINPVIAVFHMGSALASTSGASRRWPPPHAGVAGLSCRSVVLLAPLLWRNRGGAWARPRGQRSKGQDYGRPRWSSCHRPCYGCFTTRSPPCGPNAHRVFCRWPPRTTDRGHD
jgi:hypothetical protein